MGIDKKQIKLWKEKREDVATTFKVLRELDIMKEEDVAFLTEKLDIAARGCLQTQAIQTRVTGSC